MNEVQYERMQENAALGTVIAENLQAILDLFGVLNVAQLSHRIYKDTACGAALSVQTHDGDWRHSGNLDGIGNGNVRALRITSIIEGSDTIIQGDVIDLMRFDTTEQAVRSFCKQIEFVESEVDQAAALDDDTE